ncbi:TPA: 50S ribosomal protein L23 [Candidatus Nomurabacteria bacterium]|uniref:Large ribosomal subunit protein uL23 n=2 Tax=Candidatus Nomuraibacteriota TaxID=1752729 RepID=A0A1F6YN70_9BACT|nr:MAG: 50S ribosomal protein L23 [Parcubacteria group bacterium GW2011_GWC1_42_21]KKS58743.1 MAG: 50S ribosomal protein L23 [Candidatus Nomurabacteria bacterium GW2011_GWF1_42_40]KKT00067.1 MAG: 50S ribosomal protein L23 [Candidatus Nomurabacteria bacterium GW2011_GWA1_43_17]KKT08002.1 MAG: 50S ribosomal protein L23 [Candidatus Nomurabacteria bacterium GW2011_GWB1_43_19]KKT11552.1 MAG: 50S ribosomal protein L23 [Candidatus Nomurabacteria bacterium GW2011_GWF2_43_24]KKT18084.1 MAG: 50S ribosom
MTTIIKNPRVTEKASNANEQNVYTFDIAKSANKTEIKKAVFTLYKVLPVRINVLSVPRKTIMSKGKIGTRGGGKKAVVYLKGGDKIEFI